MSQPYRGGPDEASVFTLADGRSAVHVPRERTHYSGLHSGYPLTEDFLSRLASDDVDVIVIDDGDQVYLFDHEQYRWGNRVGHAPYQMKRVVPLDDATVGLTGSSEPSVNGSPAWLDDDDDSPSASNSEDGSSGADASDDSTSN